MSTDKKEYGISVIIPCYNVGQYVEETLKSVLNQSFKNYEIICLNDGSTDGTLEILNKYQSLYPYIQVFTGENHGVAYQRNKGVQRARGKYIYYLDGDDLIKENCLETLYQYAEFCILRQKVFTNQKKLRKHFLNFLHYIIDIKSMMVFMMVKICTLRWRIKAILKCQFVYNLCVGNF